MITNSAVRLGIVGLGAMGRQHALWLQAGRVNGLRLCAVVDPHGHGASFAAERLPGVTVYESEEAMLAGGQIDAALICSPPQLHAEQTCQALLHGLHVLCEKPVSLHLAEAQKNQQLAESRGLIYAMAFNQRMNPVYQAVKRALGSGRLGRLHRVLYIGTDCFRAQCYYNAAAWRATWAMEGGGMLMNQNAHTLDLLLWWLGMPKAVTAHLGFGRYHEGIAVEDDVNVCLQYEDGAVCSLITSTGDYPGSSLLELQGDRGKLSVRNGRLIWEGLDVPSSVFSMTYQGGFGHPTASWEDITPPEEDTAHVGLLQSFADAIRNGVPPAADAQAGLRALELAHAIYCSAWWETTVCLPIADALFEEEWLRRARAEEPRKAVPVALELQSTWQKRV